ncbi:MAG TPA: hypothetical protein VMS29_00050 [Pyrinomonadaceae bacterium]|jgi:hypothetical protein|nr:hypothetical protein [Pyrinomonadaceae bacterium]
MYIRMMLVSLAIAVLMVVPSFADSTGCKKGEFFGSYTRPELSQDVLGDGSAIHSFTYQLNLHNDGTATQYWTGLNDYLITLGTGSPWTGSWTCRSDGKLIVTMIVASYFPVTNNQNVTSPDVELRSHFRDTYLFNVVDENTLIRIQSRRRAYLPAADPTNPAGGTLGPLSTTSVAYNRLVASDADLLVP